MKPTPTAYSYIRFSHSKQAEGDSLRRQVESTREWCARNGVALDESTTLHDLGRSAYTGKHRENPDRHALATFLKLVEQGKVPRGSYLIVETLDRLSREHIQPALLLVLNLLQAGVRVVQLKPVEMVFDDKSDSLPVMMMMMELSRGHGESAIKSERVGKAWREKKKAARERGEVLTRQLPAWIELRGGKLQLIPERAAVIRRIFHLTANGYGLTALVRQLIEEGTPAFGRTGEWDRGYVSKILRGRDTMGEFQPRYGQGKGQDGEPIPNYYPAAVTEEEWLAARAGAAQRRAVLDKNGKYQQSMPNRRGGRIGIHVNVFSGLLRDARDGGTYYIGAKNPGSLILTNESSQKGQPGYYFPFPVFEEAVLKLLREVDPAEVLGQDSGPDEAQLLGAEHGRLEALIAELTEALEGKEVQAVVKKLGQLEDRKKDVAERWATAQRKAQSPLSSAWGEQGTLIDALARTPDPRDARLRLRSLLRRTVESMHLLVVKRARQDRLAALRVQFAGSESHRDYLIFCRTHCGSGKFRKPPLWWAHSFAAAGGLDLRKPSDVKKVEALLQRLDLNEPVQ